MGKKCRVLYGRSVARSRNIPIRFSEQMIAELEAAAKGLGFQNRSDIVKLCVQSFLTHFQTSGMEALPLNWKALVKDLDGRTHRYAKKRNGTRKGGQG